MKRLTGLFACAVSLLALGCAEDQQSRTTSSAGVAVAAATPPPRVAKPRPPVDAAPVDDAEAAASFPAADPSALSERPPAPETAKPAVASRDNSTSESYISPGAPSDEQIARELRELDQIERSYKTSASSPAGRATLNSDGTATPPKNAPETVRRIIGAANAIAKFPYVYGGGHGSFVDTAYDCSGSVSYALAGAGLLQRTMVSGEFAKAGEEGPGKWVTIYANGGHMFMVVAGLRFDTSGRDGPLGSRWQTADRRTSGFAVRHIQGL